VVVAHSHRLRGVDVPPAGGLFLCGVLGVWGAEVGMRLAVKLMG